MKSMWAPLSVIDDKNNELTDGRARQIQTQRLLRIYPYSTLSEWTRQHFVHSDEEDMKSMKCKSKPPVNQK